MLLRLCLQPQSDRPLLLRLFTVSAPSQAPTVLGTHTSLLMTFTRPSRRPAVNGVALSHCEVSVDVARLSENRVSIIHDVRSLREQGVDAVRIICVSI